MDGPPQAGCSYAPHSMHAGACSATREAAASAWRKPGGSRARPRLLPARPITWSHRRGMICRSRRWPEHRPAGHAARSRVAPPGRLHGLRAPSRPVPSCPGQCGCHPNTTPPRTAGMWHDTRVACPAAGRCTVVLFRASAAAVATAAACQAMADVHCTATGASILCENASEPGMQACTAGPAIGQQRRLTSTVFRTRQEHTAGGHMQALHPSIRSCPLLVKPATCIPSSTRPLQAAPALLALASCCSLCPAAIPTACMLGLRPVLHARANSWSRIRMRGFQRAFRNGIGRMQ